MERNSNNTKEKWDDGEFYMEEQSDHEDESLSLCDLPNSHFPFDKKPTAVDTPIAAAAAADDFDFGSVVGFCNSVGEPPPEMCLADEVFYQGQLLPIRLSVSSDNSSAGFHRRHAAIGKFNSSGSSSSKSQCSSSTVTNNSIKTSRTRVLNLFHSHPSPKPQIKASPAPATLRQGSSGRRFQKSSSAWDFIRVGVVNAPGVLELQDLKHRRNSSISRSNSGGDFTPVTTGSGCGGMRRPRERESIERKSRGILSGVGCKCSVESTVSPAVAVRRKNGINKNIPAEEMKKVEKEKEQQEKLALSRQRTFEWLKDLSHATFPCEAYILA